MKLLPENKILRFLTLGGGFYLIWLLLYHLIITRYTWWDFYLNYNVVWTGKQLLSIFGIHTFIEIESEHIVLMLDFNNRVGVWVGDACNGFKLFSVFSIFIIAFPGPVKKKIWFIPFGILLIHLANIIRVALLLVIFHYYPDSLDFNHNYTFTIFVYGIIFFLWWWWAKKFSRNE